MSPDSLFFAVVVRDFASHLGLEHIVWLETMGKVRSGVSHEMFSSVNFPFT